MSWAVRVFALVSACWAGASLGHRARTTRSAVNSHLSAQLAQEGSADPAVALAQLLLAVPPAVGWHLSEAPLLSHNFFVAAPVGIPQRGAARIGTHPRMTTADDPVIVLDPFAARNFIEPGKAAEGRAFIDFDKEEFAKRVNSYYLERVAAGEEPLQAGYAPFCKHIFVPNFVSGLLDGVLAINEDTKSYLKSEYVARTDKELPVLTRWFPKGDVAARQQEATYLDVILYSREQIRKENAAMGNPDISDAPWGIVSVKPQSINTEIPMEPITMMRNALGADQGGSGVDLDRDAYARSVEFWDKHARVQ
mmetsp:Transcript_101158/g.184648  ORF Transcript_101158/g.184648 Transcript_101158/m.184648 type:complete len:308 (+) Transcript_101158:82-1005(+)